MIFWKFKNIKVVFTEGCSGTSFSDRVAETLGICGILRVFWNLAFSEGFFCFFEIKKLEYFWNSRRT